MRILALVPGGIGDQILFFPTLNTLKQCYPLARIDVVVEPRSRGAYRVCAAVEGTIPFDFKGRNSAADFINLLGTIREREYDIALSLGSRWSVGFLLWLNGIPVRVGYAGSGSLFLSNSVALKSEQYAAHMYHDLVQGLGIQAPCPPVKVDVSQADIAWMEAEQERLGIKDTPYVLIHGGSSQLALSKGINKIYPPEKWQRIVGDIQTKQPNLPILLLHGPEDGDWVAQMQAASADLKTISPGDVGKLAAAIAGANLMLCTDSAPMHLAVAVGTYVIALFGPTDAQKLLPPGSDRCVGIQSPTDNIADIDPDTVLQKVWRG